MSNHSSFFFFFFLNRLFAVVQSPEAIQTAKASQKSVLGAIQQEKLPLHVRLLSSYGV